MILKITELVKLHYLMNMIIYKHSLIIEKNEPLIE